MYTMYTFPKLNLNINSNEVDIFLKKCFDKLAVAG